MPENSPYDLQHIVAPTTSSGIEFEKLRFEYAWRHFDIYSRQILQMFNFFMISTAFLYGAFASVANSHRSDYVPIASVIAMIGLAVSLIFLAFDWRSRKLFMISRRHLEALERNILYPEGFREIYANPAQPGSRVKGIMIEDAERVRIIRHSYLIPICQLVSAGMFLLLLLWVNNKF